MPSIADIANLAGVSTWTVSVALRDLPGVTPETRDRIKAIAQALHYAPRRRKAQPEVARALVGIITHQDIGPFVTDIVQGAMAQAYQDGLQLVFFQVPREDRLHYTAAIHDLLVSGVKGIVLVNGRLEALPRDLVLTMWSAGVYPVAVQQARFAVPTDRVSIDPESLVRLAADYLCGLGHREIACLYYPGGELFLGHLERELARQDARLVASDTVDDMCYLPEAFSALWERARFTALCLPDFWCWHVQMRAMAQGLRVPEDLSLLGLCRIHHGCFATHLSSVELSPRMLGSQAIALLRRRLDEGVPPNEITPEEIMLTPELALRQSCAPPPALVSGPR